MWKDYIWLLMMLVIRCLIFCFFWLVSSFVFVVVMFSVVVMLICVWIVDGNFLLFVFGFVVFDRFGSVDFLEVDFLVRLKNKKRVFNL